MATGFVHTRDLSPNEEIVVDILGQHDDYLEDLLDANCARVVQRFDGFYVVPFGRINGQEYQDAQIGPFHTHAEAYTEAEVVLEEAE
jgi:hypothetical protein